MKTAPLKEADIKYYFDSGGILVEVNYMNKRLGIEGKSNCTMISKQIDMDISATVKYARS